jgi:hypothetical protein
MDARRWFLYQHEHVHTRLADFVLRDLTDDQMRVVPPGHNSIVWFFWHITRGEDIGVNAVLRGAPEVITRDAWGKRLGVKRLDFGAGMTADEVAAFSAGVDLEALRAYRAAVRDETRAWVETFDFDVLDAPLDPLARLAAAPLALGPGSEPLHPIIARQTSGWYWLPYVAIGRGYGHLFDAEHVSRLLRVGGVNP